MVGITPLSADILSPVISLPTTPPELKCYLSGMIARRSCTTVPRIRGSIGLVTRMNHERPIFKLLADLKRDKSVPLSDSLMKLEKKFASATKSSRTPARTTKSHEKKVIHEVAMDIFDRLARHNDVRIVRSLLDAVEKDSDRKAILEWFCRYGRITSNAGKLGLSKEKYADRAAAVTNPYWTLISKSPQNRAAFNLVRELEKLVGKATERALSPSPRDDVDLVLLGEIKRLISR